MFRFESDSWRLAMLTVCWWLNQANFVNAQASNEAKFFRGLNLNGPALTIDGNPWDGKDASWYECHDKAFENQNVSLTPPTSDSLAQMIRSSRWGGNRIVIRNLPEGEYSLFLYVWEDNQSETYTISLNGRPVMVNHRSGRAGDWDRLGPWFVKPQKGTIELTSKGGAANFSGIEIWSGHHDGLQESYAAEQLTFFEQRIRPVLIESCYECHSQESAEPGAGLLVDSRNGLRQGSASGPAVVPGKPTEGTLLRAIKYHEEALQMPPEGKLSDSIIADFEHWISTGAADPRSSATKHQGKKIDVAEARSFWSLRPIERAAPH